MKYSPFELYSAFSTDKHLFVKGRLLAKRAIESSTRDGYFKSLMITLWRALTKELRHHPLEIRCNNEVFKLTTDEEGYFELQALLQEEKKPVEAITLVADVKNQHWEEREMVHYYPQLHTKGVISDVDDTILQTGVTSFLKLRLVFNSLFINPFRRQPLENAADFYHRLIRGEKANGVVVYISNSPWNMHDYLSAFLKHYKFPIGELMLRDFGWHMFRKKPILENQAKFQSIEKVLNVFEKTTFTLIGDSAELDYNIYHKIAQKYPDRIDEIIIVKVKGSKRNQDIMEKIAADPNARTRMIDRY